MNLRLLHFYPDMMNLYGSAANIQVLQRALERLGHTVEIIRIAPAQDVFQDIPANHAEKKNKEKSFVSDSEKPVSVILPECTGDFIYMGAGTERSMLAVLRDFVPRYAAPVRTLAEAGIPMLFAGTAMELLGQSVTDTDNKIYAGAGLAAFVSVQGKERILGDVYGHTDLYPEAIVGYMNKCAVIQNVDRPLIQDMQMGYGNEGEKSPEGFLWKNVCATELTGPVLVKNPKLLKWIIQAIYQQHGEPVPEVIPEDTWAMESWRVTEEALRKRFTQEK